MSENNGGVDWRDVEDTHVVFEPSDRVDPSTIDPKTRKALNEAMEKLREWYRECLGVEDDNAEKASPG